MRECRVNLVSSTKLLSIQNPITSQITLQIIKTHDSESRDQEEAGRTRRMSVLFTGNTAVKLVNALNKPP